MKKFLLRTALFFAILYALAWVADLVITQKCKKVQAAPYASWNDIYADRINSDVIIMGTSRAFVHFNPAIIDSVQHTDSYNLGMDGRPTDAQIVKYHAYRRHCSHKPKVILYELYGGSMDKSNGYQREQFVPYLKDTRLWKEARELEHFSIADRTIPCWRYIGRKKMFKDIIYYSKHHQDDLYKGFKSHKKSWNGDRISAIKQLNYPMHKSRIRQFENFIGECTKDGVKVVFVYVPMYIEATQKTTDLKGIQNTFAQIANKYDIPILDYTYDALSYDTCYFYNAQHLNSKGANLFSTKLSHDIDSLGILR